MKSANPHSRQVSTTVVPAEELGTVGMSEVSRQLAAGATCVVPFRMKSEFSDDDGWDVAMDLVRPEHEMAGLDVQYSPPGDGGFVDRVDAIYCDA